jgi:HK97 family phage major capsid protein
LEAGRLVPRTTMFVELLKDFLGKKAGERIHLAETEAKELIAAGLARAVSEDVITPLVSRALESALGGFTRGLDAIITRTLEQFADAQRQARKHAVPAIFGPGGNGDPKKTFGDWCLAVARKDTVYLEKHYNSRFVEYSQKAALAESSGTTGGYTVPPEFFEQLMTIVAENSFIRPRAFVVPMASASLQIPYLDITTTQSAGVSPFFGGVQMYWTAEAQTRTETEPAFKQMELKAWELSGYSVSSNVLLADSIIGLEKFLMNLFGLAIAWFEEYAFLQGNGVGKPQGMLTAGAAVSVNRNTGSEVQFVDVATMWSKLLPRSWGSAIWTFSPSVVPQLLQLKDGANRAIFISIDQGVTKTPTWSLLGRPAFPTEKVPALGTKGDLMLLDPSLYVIGDRMQVEIAASEHVNFLKRKRTITGQGRPRPTKPRPGRLLLQDDEAGRELRACAHVGSVQADRELTAPAYLPVEVDYLSGVEVRGLFLEPGRQVNADEFKAELIPADEDNGLAEGRRHFNHVAYYDVLPALVELLCVEGVCIVGPYLMSRDHFFGFGLRGRGLDLRRGLVGGLDLDRGRGPRLRGRGLRLIRQHCDQSDQAATGEQAGYRDAARDEAPRLRLRGREDFGGLDLRGLRLRLRGRGLRPHPVGLAATRTGEGRAGRDGVALLTDRTVNLAHRLPPFRLNTDGETAKAGRFGAGCQTVTASARSCCSSSRYSPRRNERQSHLLRYTPGSGSRSR